MALKVQQIIKLINENSSKPFLNIEGLVVLNRFTIDGKFNGKNVKVTCWLHNFAYMMSWGKLPGISLKWMDKLQKHSGCLSIGTFINVKMENMWSSVLKRSSSLFKHPCYFKRTSGKLIVKTVFSLVVFIFATILYLQNILYFLLNILLW